MEYITLFREIQTLHNTYCGFYNIIPSTGLTTPDLHLFFDFEIMWILIEDFIKTDPKYDTVIPIIQQLTIEEKKLLYLKSIKQVLTDLVVYTSTTAGIQIPQFDKVNVEVTDEFNPYLRQLIFQKYIAKYSVYCMISNIKNGNLISLITPRGRSSNSLIDTETSILSVFSKLLDKDIDAGIFTP